MARPTCSLVPLLIVLAGITAQAQDREPDVMYVPTPPGVVHEMLLLAGVKEGDLVYDLGSGDGRIVIAAARDFGARGVGIDLDRELIEESIQNAKDAGVDDRVEFIHGDLFEADFSHADVVTLFLLTGLNIRLKPALLSTLRPGTPVVSHLFNMGEWEPDEELIVATPERNHELYLWIIPAQIEGRWVSETPAFAEDEEFEIALLQHYQKIKGELILDGRLLEFTEATLRGDTVSIAIEESELAIQLRGKVTGDEIEGSALVYTGGNSKEYPWRARRKSEDP